MARFVTGFALFILKNGILELAKEKTVHKKEKTID